jgi:hypothetical protein
VTVIRDKREQNLTLTIPDRKSSGGLLEESFDVPDFTAETEQAVNRAGDVLARIAPEMEEALLQQNQCWKDSEKELQDHQQELREREEEMQEQVQEGLQERQQEMRQEFQQKIRHQLSRQWAEI